MESARARHATDGGTRTLPPIMSKLLPRCLLSTVAMACALALPSAGAADTKALLEKYRCTICHDDRDTLAGPSWLDIAARYHGQKQANVILSAKIRAGARGGGLWNMPPHPEVTKVDAEAMATYILTLKK
jgi:cytochrome c